MPDYEAKDFLPFSVEKKEQKITKETAKIVLAAMKKNRCPVKVVRAIIDCDLYDEILRLGEDGDG